MTGVNFVHYTTNGTSVGISENYNGNEEDPDAEEMKFKKSEREILNIIHTHVLAMSMNFFILALLVFICRIPKKLKYFLMIEPLISVLLTFGGIYFLWLEIPYMTYIIMLSGAFMVLSYVCSIGVILREFLYRPRFSDR